MSRYFMRDTHLHCYEQQMMTSPYAKPRGHGIKASTFRYNPNDVDCHYCTRYKRKNPCALHDCICLEERIEAGILGLKEFVRAILLPLLIPQLQTRVQDQFFHSEQNYFLNEGHRQRWEDVRYICYRMSDRNKAALFLLTAYRDLWRRVRWKFDDNGIDFQSVKIAGIESDLYSVYQAAKAIATDSKNITFADLASPDLVTDEAFRLIICALLLAKYGDAILNLKERTGEESNVQSNFGKPQPS